MKDHFDYRKFKEVMHILHSLTKIDVRLLDQNEYVVDQIISHEIPAVMAKSHEEYAHIHQILQRHGSGHYYHHVDSYNCAYIASGIWTDRSFIGSIIIGPFISSLSAVELVMDTITNNNLPIGERRQLEHFYESMPVVSNQEYQHLGELLSHLCIHNHILSKPILAHTPRISSPTDLQTTTIEESKQMIEQRYKRQNELMDAITRGDKNEANELIDYLNSEVVIFSDRVPGNPIRPSKNIGFVLNTVCRIAAERSGVHPVYLHNISERFAIQIEYTSTLPKLKQLFQTMVMEYCELVTLTATGQYSPTVKRTVDYILLNLGSPLNLKQIAKRIHINPSNLSRKFKEETGLTITEFINRKRVEEAAAYLQRGNISVTEVAFLVGFNDLNYFSKVFKKIMSVTPSQYAGKRK